jgi:hypothetical protein
MKHIWQRCELLRPRHVGTPPRMSAPPIKAWLYALGLLLAPTLVACPSSHLVPARAPKQEPSNPFMGILDNPADQHVTTAYEARYAD